MALLYNKCKKLKVERIADMYNIFREVSEFQVL
jgi:hypothetical protein